MPTTQLTDADLTDGAIGIMDLLVATGLAASKSEARRLITQGGIAIDGEKVESIDHVVTKEALANSVKIKKGKKVFHKVLI